MMKDAIVSDNVDMFVSANNLIIDKCGGTIQFTSLKEFDELMCDEKPYKL